MKNKFKFIVLFFTILINFNNIIFANSNNISKVDFEAKINDDGSVSVTEIWKGNFYIGTELYNFYENLKLEDIKEFCVIEDGVKFQNKDNWEITASKEEKSKKSAIIQTEDGIEFTWGIGNLGYHQYKLKYRLNNVFKNDELNLKILNINYINIQEAEIKINGNFSENAFASLNNCVGTINLKQNQAIYKINNFNDYIDIYLNYDGIDNSKKNNNIIKIKSKNKNKLFFILKSSIFVLLFLIIFVLFIIFFGFRKKEVYEFKPF